MNNEITNIDKIHLKIVLSNEIDRNLKSIELYSRLENMQSFIDYLTSRNNIYELLIDKLENNATV
jgi:hypothetical protein